MNNDKLIEIDGVKMPISKIRHWQYRPEEFVPNRSEDEIIMWSLLMEIKRGWDALDANRITSILSDDFSYGSYWVKGQDMDVKAYRDYLPKKFETISRTGSKPQIDIVVLYEGLTPLDFPYALRLRQGNVTTILILKFKGGSVSSLYMTDPEIFTYEPTFAKGGIVDENGEPRLFVHECDEVRAGCPMTKEEMQEFVVRCVSGLMREAGDEVDGVYRSPYKEFPSIVTRCGSDTFYHRIDVSNYDRDNGVIESELQEFIKTANLHKAWPMVMPVSLMCATSESGAPICGGGFFMKVLESRRIDG